MASAEPPRRIALIVTTYNRPDALARVLAGCGAQTDGAFDVIVADGLCTTAGQYAGERVGAVIRRNDKGDATRRLSACHDDAAASA